MADETSTASTSTMPPPRLAAPTPAPAPPKDHTVALAILRMLERAIVWFVSQIIKPKARVVVVGLLLIIVGAFIIDHSVWTFPLVIIGALMIICAWVGTRLEGRFGIEWSDGGAGFEMRARFRPAMELQVRAPHLTVPAPSATTTSSSNTSTDTQPRPEPIEEVEVIEGEAHTIEIDIEELKALVAAAERANNATATTNGTSVSWQEVPLRRTSGADN